MSDRLLRVSAPATSANLGCGFDSLGIAVNLRNELEVRPGTGRVVVEGEGEGSVPLDGSNLVARAFELAAPVGMRGHYDLHCTNAIPLARGLGSSTAAAALGLVAGWELGGHEWTDTELFARLTELDGHPDNAGACVYGGLVVTRASADGPRAVAVDIGDWLRPVFVVPDREVPTDEARAALPDSYDRATVATAIQNSSMLVTALLDGLAEELALLLQDDVVHEPQRAALVPELGEVRASLTASPAMGATLSGAGPTVMVWCEDGSREQVEGTLQVDFPEHWVVALDLDLDGIRIDG